MYSFVKNLKLHIEYTQFLLCTLTSASLHFYIRYRQCSACVISLSFNAALQMGSATHYNDVIMGAMASQITSLRIVYSSVYSGAKQWKHQSSASLAYVRGFHRWPVNSPHKWPVTRKMFPFDDVIMFVQHHGEQSSLNPLYITCISHHCDIIADTKLPALVFLLCISDCKYNMFLSYLMSLFRNKQVEHSLVVRNVYCVKICYIQIFNVVWTIEISKGISPATLSNCLAMEIFSKL